MEVFAHLWGASPVWLWIALGAVLLAAEAATGSGWLLWPAVSAGLVAVLRLTPLPLQAPNDLALFAALTLVTTFAARRWLRRPAAHAAGDDINDQAARLIGRSGVVAEAFSIGQGRVRVGGAEWAAELEGGGSLDVGAAVIVAGLHGARLVVRAA